MEITVNYNELKEQGFQVEHYEGCGLGSLFAKAYRKSAEIFIDNNFVEVSSK